MNNRTLQCGILLLHVFLLSCTGLRFANEPTDRPLPRDLRNRTIAPDSSNYKYRPGELVGHLVLKQHDGNITRINRIAPSAPPVEVTKDGLLYRSKITNNSSAQGSYLAFSASMSSEEVTELTIADVAHAYLDTLPTVVADAAMRAYANKTPEVFFVQGVVLSVITRESWVQIDSDARGVIGSAAGIAGKVYNAKGDLTRDYPIALELVDLFSWGKHMAESPFPLGDLTYPLDGLPGIAEATTSGGTLYQAAPLKKRLSALVESSNSIIAEAAKSLQDLFDKGALDSGTLRRAWDTSVQSSVGSLAANFRARPMGVVIIE